MSLSIKNLSHRFSRGQDYVLKDLNFEMSDSPIVKIHGGNGAGKTTLLRIVATHLYPTQGDVFFNNNRTFKGLNDFRKRLSWLQSEGGCPFFRLSGDDNLALFFSYRKSSTSYHDLKQEWSELPSFKKALNTPFYLCSSGMKQILSLARCLETPADLYVLDEPTRYLDHQAREFVEKKMVELSKKSKILIASHNPTFLKSQGKDLHLLDGKLEI